jgi:Rod binding domain-containing protein
MRAVDAMASTAGDLRLVPQPRLMKAAHEFEAQLMKELLKPMTNDDAFCSDGGDLGSSGILGEFAAEALGSALSEHGGLGIASSIVRSLSHTGNPSESGSA